MSALIQELLTNYYGIGVEHGTQSPLSTHDAYLNQENSFEKSISADKTNITSADSIIKNQGLEVMMKLMTT